MEQAPLPPHERAWRHPSEVAAELKVQVNAERASTATRVAAITVGATGLLMVGLVLLAITPPGPDNPVALSATTLPVVVVQSAPSFAAEAATPRLTGAERLVFRAVGSTEQGPPVTTSIVVVRPLATPVGDGTIALVTTHAVQRHEHTRQTDESLTVEIGDNWWGSASALRDVDSTLVTLVHLDGVQPGYLPSLGVADEQPGPDDIVLVLTHPPVEVMLSDIDELAVRDGTAVVDADGDLIGLCVVHDDRGATLAPVDQEAVDAAVDDTAMAAEDDVSASTETD